MKRKTSPGSEENMSKQQKRACVKCLAIEPIQLANVEKNGENALCSDHGVICKNCTQNYCDKHANRCTWCSTSYCIDCDAFEETCSNTYCSQKLCNKCYKKCQCCSKCENRVCGDHDLQNCHNCDEDICEDCYDLESRYCDTGGQGVCGDCDVNQCKRCRQDMCNECIAKSTCRACEKRRMYCTECEEEESGQRNDPYLCCQCEASFQPMWFSYDRNADKLGRKILYAKMTDCTFQ